MNIKCVVLRAVSEGRISWGFWPPGTSFDIISKHNWEPDTGIWIPGQDDDSKSSEDESDEKEEMEEDGSRNSSDEGESEEEVDVIPVNAGRFNALHIDDPESGSESEK
jgi:hypothetical protein